MRVVNDIRKERGDLDSHWPHTILNIYWKYLIPPNEHKAAFLSAIPPPDHVDTFDWLLRSAGPDESDTRTHDYIRSALLEAAGRRAEALAGYRTVESRFAAGSSGTLMDETRKAVVRLTAGK
jgi:hypothetical protein